MFSRRPLSDEVNAALAAAVRDVDPTPLGGETDELRMLGPLAEAVRYARYWQEPDEEDAICQTSRIRSALAPIAEALVASPATRWWSTPLVSEQRHVAWDALPSFALDVSGAATKLAAWKSATGADEARDRPSDPAASYSGEWWSTPALFRLPHTTRALPGLFAVHLALVEDGLGWEEARVSEVTAAAGIRIYEISGPEAWANLVASHSLDVTLSRRHDWRRTTEHEGSWLIPDWAAVANDFDAIHLSVAGYLTTAGRAIPVGSSHSVLAGWSPDETYWLTDVLEAGATVDWQKTGNEPTEWSPVV